MEEFIIDAFTREGNNTNLEVNNLNVDCITSTNNNFTLDSNGNLTVNSINTNNIVGTGLLNYVYPVGSIYISVSSTNPSTLFGGTWEQLKDRFLLGCGDTYQNGVTGGEATHTLTTNEMPSHNHTTSHFTFINGNSEIAGVAQGSAFTPAGFGRSTTDINNAGGGHAHNNMPPYLAVYIWKRIS